MERTTPHTEFNLGVAYSLITVVRDSEDDKYHKSWKKSIMLVWRMISQHKFANVFMHQVTDDIAPNYSSCVFRYGRPHLVPDSVMESFITDTLCDRVCSVCVCRSLLWGRPGLLVLQYSIQLIAVRFDPL